MSTVYVNEVLCYMVHFMKCSTEYSLKNVLSKFYTLDELNDAKTALLENTCPDGRAIIENVQDFSRSRRSVDKSVSDLIAGVAALDKEHFMPIFSAVKLDRIPSFEPEDLSLVAVIDRLARLESNHVNCERTITSIQSELSEYKLNVHKNSDMLKSICENSNTENLHSKTKNSQPERIRNNTYAKRLTMCDKIPSTTTRWPSWPDQLDGTSANYQKPLSKLITHDNDWAGSSHSVNSVYSKLDGFEPSRYEKKKDKRKQNKLITGSKKGPKLARVPRYHFHIRNVSNDVNDDEIKTLIEDTATEIIEFVKVSNETAFSKSYRLSIPADDQEKILDEDVWPEGIVISRFFFPRKRIDNLLVKQNNPITDNGLQQPH